MDDELFKDWDLPERVLFGYLATHTEQNPIKLEDLSNLTGYDTRSILEAKANMISNLGVPVGASRSGKGNGGLYLIHNDDEMKRVLLPMITAVQSQLKIINALQQISLHDFYAKYDLKAIDASEPLGQIDLLECLKKPS